MRPPLFPRAFVRLLPLLVLLLGAHVSRAAKPAWRPVEPAELAATSSTLEPDAAAEVVFLRVEVDDRGYPSERVTTTYVRYKIFDPDKADEITRVTNVEFARSDDRMQLQARLVLPDGRVQEFGKEAIKERPLVQQAKQSGFLGWLASGGPVATERFLAITGVERGAVLEYYTVVFDRFPGAVSVIAGQRERFPVRRFEYHARRSTNSAFLNRTFVSNRRVADVADDPKARTVSVVAENLPSIVLEPFSGPVTEHILTVFNCYEQATFYLMPRSGKVPMPATVSGAAGPWAAYSTVINWVSRDRGLATKRVKQLATELTQAGKNEPEKAAAIHRWVSRDWQAYRTHTQTTPRTRAPNSLDQVMDWKKERDVAVAPDDFLWLALSLYQSAGLTAHPILLPNREFTRFNPGAVSPVFLPFAAIAIRSGESWLFSSPHHGYSLPFNMLPWQQEGQQGLLALDQKQEFIPIEVSPPERSILGTAATLELDATGTLHGEFTRRLSGQLAAPVRGELLALAEADRFAHARQRLGLDLKAAEITVTKIDGLTDAEAPLDVTCTLRWEDFATRTKDRIVVRPLPFRAEAVTPFTAEKRKGVIYFPHRWQEVDQLKIRLPEGYQLESPSTPGGVPGESLHYKLEFTIDETIRTLFVRRQFMSNVVAVPAEKYDPLRKFYDYIVRSDQHELVLRRVADVK